MEFMNCFQKFSYRCQRTKIGKLLILNEFVNMLWSKIERDIGKYVKSFSWRHRVATKDHLRFLLFTCFFVLFICIFVYLKLPLLKESTILPPLSALMFCPTNLMALSSFNLGVSFIQLTMAIAKSRVLTKTMPRDSSFRQPLSIISFSFSSFGLTLSW